MKKFSGKVRVRFAPSPTGSLHIGGLRTALFNYLYARQKNGDFILRIEDTDRRRQVEGATESLLQTLRTVGLKWDEEPVVQSRRLPLYRQHAEDLVKKDKAYHCFCSAERLAELRRRQQADKQPTKYDGYCRSRPSATGGREVKNEYVIRLAVPKEGTTAFHDLIHGEVRFANELTDDQVLLKSDGYPTYHLANVVDDHLMGISHVIRGEEWLSSTPKHILLYQAFDWEPPQFAHLPLLLNSDRSKLSKRQGDAAVEEYLKNGYLPEALLNFVALLGWNPGTEKEIFSLAELIEEFDLTRVQKAGAVFNLEKLDWLNGEYIRRTPIQKLVEMCLPHLATAGFMSAPDVKNPELRIKIKKIVELEKERLKKLSDLPPAAEFFFKEPEYPAEMLIWRKSDEKTARQRLSRLAEFYKNWSDGWTKDALEQRTLELIKNENLDNGATLWPLRAALSGREKSPPPFEIAEILGKKETIARLQRGLAKISA